MLESIDTDLAVGALELRGTRAYELGHLPVEQDGGAWSSPRGPGRDPVAGVDARYDPSLGCIDLLLVSHADDPKVPAPLFAARLEG